MKLSFHGGPYNLARHGEPPRLLLRELREVLKLEFRVCLANPPLDLLPKVGRKRRHLRRFFVRNRTAHFVAAHVAFLAEGIEAPNLFAGSSDGELKGLDDATMVSLMVGTETGRREGPP